MCPLLAVIDHLSYLQGSPPGVSSPRIDTGCVTKSVVFNTRTTQNAACFRRQKWGMVSSAHCRMCPSWTYGVSAVQGCERLRYPEDDIANNPCFSSVMSKSAVEVSGVVKHFILRPSSALVSTVIALDNRRGYSKYIEGWIPFYLLCVMRRSESRVAQTFSRLSSACAFALVINSRFDWCCQRDWSCPTCSIFGCPAH